MASFARPLPLREFAFGDEDFEALRGLVKSLTGINLSDQKRELVYGRLCRRLRALGVPSFREYRAILSDGRSRELVNFCNAITTNLTAFFRESHHFEFLREHLLAPRSAGRPAPQRMRFWCAGCSTGEEPYSLAMTVREALPESAIWDVRILATDLDTDVLEKGRRGVYAADRLRGTSPGRCRRFFHEHRAAGVRTYTVTESLRSLITFKELNLIHPLPLKGPIDAVFCRNVVIYFDEETQRALFARIAKLQNPGALLFLGHAENLFRVSDAYTLVGKTIYRRN